MTAPSEADFTAVTTRAKQKRHWALTANLTVHTDPAAGRTGATLCPGGRGSGEAIDQDRLNAILPPGLNRRYVIAELRPCRLCAEIRARRLAGRTS